MPDEIDLDEEDELAMDAAWDRLSREEQARKQSEQARQFGQQWDAQTPPPTPPQSPS